MCDWDFFWGPPFVLTVARFDFSWLDAEYQQETLDNLRKAVKSVKKLCAVSLGWLVYPYPFFCS